jgi:hypothetical protein
MRVVEISDYEVLICRHFSEGPWSKISTRMSLLKKLLIVQTKEEIDEKLRKMKSL